MKKEIIYLLISFFLIACASRKKLTEEDFSTFKNRIQQGYIEVEFTWANPLGLANVRGINGFFVNGSTQNNISLVGNQNFFILKKDSLYIDLPYYGTHQISAPLPGTNIGITFEGVPKTKNIVFNEEKQRAIVKYDVITDNDSYNMILTLFPGKTANLNVSCDRKTAISYKGNWSVLRKN